jgi:hypothetical protein
VGNPVTRVTGYDANGISFVADGVFTVELTNATIAGGISLEKMTFGSLATINIHALGIDTFHLSFGAEDFGAVAVVDIARNSTWVGSFTAGQARSLTVNGGAHAVFDNNAASRAGGIAVVLNTDLAGTGSVTLGNYRGWNASLTANEAVGPGQTIVLGYGNDSRVNLNDPKAFAGTLQLGAAVGGPLAYGSADITLAGLPDVASESFKNDILTLYNAGGHAVDTLHLIAPVGSFTVERTATGVSIYTATDFYHASGTLLAAHA